MTSTIAGKRVIVTGANSGIGRATVAELARLGARVTMTARDAVKGEAALAELRSATDGEIELRHLDLADLGSVRAFADEFLAEHARLDVLINNAGVMAGARRETAAGHEWTFGVNHLGPFLLTNLLAPALLTAAPARVVTVSSEVHRNAKGGIDLADLQMTRRYTSSRAYAVSKLANILFTVELDRRLGPSGVVARALHPGVIATGFGKGADSPWWMGLAMRALSPVLRKPDRGAQTSVLLAIADDAEIGRALYWSEGEPKDPAPAAVDPDVAARLWEESERLVGLA